MKVFVVISLVLTTSLLGQTPAPDVSSGKHPFTFEDMMKLKRVGAPVPSPDGKWVVFDCEDIDLEANTKISHLWIVPASGGESRRLNQTPNHEERPRFSPDGERLIWTSKATDPTQIWMCDFDTSAGTLVDQPHQVTNISTGADGAIWSPDGKNIVFVSAVYPDCKDDACNKQRDDGLKKSKVKAKIFTRLFYRHWNAYTEFKRSHLFVVSADANRGAEILSPGQAGVSPAESQTPDKMSGGPTAGTAAPQQTPGPPSEPRDLTPGDHDVPPFHLGGQDMYAISPDGQEVAYTSNINEVEATSTNNDIFIVPMASGNRQSGSDPKKISTSPGSDSTPLYSPDEKYIAWRSQARAGFEADKWRLFVQDRQSAQTRDLTDKFDRSVGSFAWMQLPSDGGPVVWFAAEHSGNSPIWAVNPAAGGIPDTPSGPIRNPIHADDFAVAGTSLFFTSMSIDSSNEIWRKDLAGMHDSVPIAAAVNYRVTHMNDALLSQIGRQRCCIFQMKATGCSSRRIRGCGTRR
jgi:dipeptidyl aminopeptidase/acylaminoacyl peptidase